MSDISQDICRNDHLDYCLEMAPGIASLNFPIPKLVAYLHMSSCCHPKSAWLFVILPLKSFESWKMTRGIGMIRNIPSWPLTSMNMARRGKDLCRVDAKAARSHKMLKPKKFQNQWVYYPGCSWKGGRHPSSIPKVSFWVGNQMP